MEFFEKRKALKPLQNRSYKIINMNLEKGINRLGIVGGTLCGTILGLFLVISYLFTNFDLHIDNSKLDEVVIELLIVDFLGFLIGFFSIYGISKVINWIIKGFKGQQLT
jgi:hypothetical protein